jgi:hypothetical protein
MEGVLDTIFKQGFASYSIQHPVTSIQHLADLARKPISTHNFNVLNPA